MSKTELARKAGVSPITIDRIEKGLPRRLETKRKIMLALGMDLYLHNQGLQKMLDVRHKSS